MTDYRITTLSEQGVRLRQTRSFPGLPELDSFCRENKLTLLSYRAVRKPVRTARVHPEQARDLLDQLATLLDSGIPLADALQEVESLGAKPPVTRVLSRLYQRVAAGEALSAGISAELRLLPAYVPAMISAGEQSGKLGQSLREASEALNWQIQLRRRLWRAVSYPLFSAALLLGALGFLMVYLVPQLEAFLGATGFVLPWYTRALISFSSRVEVWALPLIGLLTVLGISMTILMRLSATWRGHLQRLLCRLPLFGKLSAQLTFSRFFHFTGTLYAAGIALPDAIRQGAAVSKVQPYSSAFDNLADDLSAGRSLTSALQDAGLIPAITLRLLGVAERSGRLEHGLSQVAGLHKQALEELLQGLESRLGPAILLLVGVLMVWVIVAVISPVYDGISAMGVGL